MPSEKKALQDKEIALAIPHHAKYAARRKGCAYRLRCERLDGLRLGGTFGQKNFFSGEKTISLSLTKSLECAFGNRFVTKKWSCLD